jgi:hypothetical protein
MRPYVQTLVPPKEQQQKEQMQSPKFKPQSHQKKKKVKKMTFG